MPLPETIVRAFAAHVQRRPDACALRDANRTLTYAEVDRSSNQAAHALIRRGVKPGSNVALLLNRSADAIVALLGIWKAGAAYMPFTPDGTPGARIEYVLGELRDPVVVTLTQYAALAGKRPVLYIDGDAAELAAASATAPSVAAGELAYIIYTSGSTGTPKGVEVTHDNLAHYTASIVEILDAKAAPLVFGLVSPLGADIGLTCVFPALASGGCLRIFDYETSLDPILFSEAVAEDPLDVLKITPTQLNALLGGQRPAEVLPRRYLICGGEILRPQLVARIHSYRACTIINHYGPTETTIGALTYRVGDGREEGGASSIPIGFPLPHARAYVVDDGGARITGGEPGELWIGGAGVARGYLGAPELTAQKFLPNPFEAGRIYRTGDRVRELPGGAIEFLGRMDAQVKVRGYRVELGEIEAVLTAQPGVRAAVVALRGDDANGEQLVAYVVSDAFDEAALRAAATQWMPDYMIPQIWMKVDALPLLPNGKADRKALPAPVRTAHAAPRSDGLAPSTAAKVAEIWGALLKRDGIGADDDFFALGGHSLLATVAVARARTAFGVKVTLRQFFAAPTVSAFAACIDDERAAQAAAETERLFAELDQLSDEEAKALLEREDG